MLQFGVECVVFSGRKTDAEQDAKTCYYFNLEFVVVF